jgi:hypothetical protein
VKGNNDAKIKKSNPKKGKNTVPKISEQEFKKFLGTKFDGYAGQAAVNKLLQEKNGYVPDAFSRKDLGSIALIWGDDNAGLAHIIKRRTADGINVKEFLADLDEVIEKGKFIRKNRLNRFEINYRNKMVIVSPEYRGNKITLVLTAFRTRKNGS